MAATTQRAVPARRVEQVIVNFNAAEVKAPFVLRCAALTVDYIIIVAIPVLMLLFGRMMGNDGSKLLGGPLNSTGYLIALLVGASNLLILPAVAGQSIGKAVTGIRIVSSTGESANFGQILRRNLIGYAVTLLTGMIGFVIAAFSSKGRALHDYIGGTVVIYGRKRAMPAKKADTVSK